MAMSVAEVDAIIEAAPDTEITLPTYTGAAGDLGYLKSYVLSAVTERYGVDASVFDGATLLSTSILRDFVHRAIYDHPELAIYDTTAPDPFSYQSDVGGLFREGGWYQCGEISWQLQNIYQSLGYKSAEFWTFNGEDGSGTPYSYNDGHVRVDVYLDDYGKYVDQDVTYNWLMVDQNDEPLSFHEAQALNFTNPSDLRFEDTGTYTYYGLDGYHYKGLPTYFDNFYRSEYMNVSYAWMEDGVYSQQIRAQTLDWYSSHTTVQFGPFDSAADGAQAILDLAGQGKTLVGITDALRPEHAVSGFRLLSMDGQSMVGDYVTVQLADGSYVSVNIGTGDILNGSYDQIVDDLTGGGQGLNPGIDTSAFFDPTVFVLYDGSVIAQWDIDQNNPLVAPLFTEEASRSPVVHMPDGETEQTYFDAYNEPWSQIKEFYNTDDSLYFKETHYDNGDYSETPYDWQGQYAWSRFEYKFDHTGQHISTAYQYDDGTSLLTKFDTKGQIWDYMDVHYNAAGLIISSFTDYDDGGYATGRYDYQGQMVWSDWQFKYNAAGQKTNELVNYDDHGYTIINYDYTNSYVWANWQYRYDAAGQPAAERVRYDDGGWVDTIRDSQHVYAWDNTQTRYDASGHMAALLVRNDDRSYSTTFYDNTNSQIWKDATWDYNSAGKLTYNEFHYDNGGKLVDNFDFNNLQPWSDWQTRTNAAGQKEADYVHYDDGHTVLTIYDPTNIQSYDHYIDTRDAQGNLLSHVVVLDDGMYRA